MNFRARLWLLVLLMNIGGIVHAQIQSNKRNKNISGKGVVFLGAQSVVPGSVAITGFDTSFYSIDYVNSILTWKKNIANDSVRISYRVFPFKLNALNRRFSYDSVRNVTVTQNRILSNLANRQDDFLNFGNIEYNGSFGRSVSFGNSQDAVFNSQFNLQMSGYIGDSIQIAAAITDNNIPIQPDGSTQQLNDFDRVLLTFRKKGWEANLGDIDLRQNDNYFLSFYKRLQGLSFSNISKIGRNVTNKTTISGAIAKGKFARNVLTVTEGNQGPYPLQGNNNELYFVILAGTEKVFMDGVQLHRGEDQDYVINYNTAQITFTSKTLISPDKRIQVEFEYADRNYLNTMMYVSNETTFGQKLQVTVAAYSNNDAKNSTINQSLDDAQKQFLANIGDSINRAYYQNVSPEIFDASKIMYRRIDTTYGNNLHDSIFVYSIDSTVGHYAPSFVDVGVGLGDYIYLNSAANGKVYQWIAPVNGVKQGQYEPATFLVTPKKQQVATVNATYNVDKKNIVKVQLATSKYDVNTFSSLDKGNDNGFAGKFNYIHLDTLKSEKHQYLLKTDAGFEYVNQNFLTVERLRPVEFSRDWGLPILTTQTTEKLPTLSLAIANENGDRLQYNFGSYIRGDGYKGVQNKLQHQQKTISGWQFNEVISMTNMTLPGGKGYYFRPTINIGKVFKGFHNLGIGAGYLMEHNQIKYGANDSLDYNSFAFETITAYIRSDQAKANNWQLSYYTRKDELPENNLLKQTTRSNNLIFSGQIFSNANRKFKYNVTYRQLSVIDTNRVTSLPEKTLLGRLEYMFNEWKGFLTGNALYEIGAGQQQKLEFTYLQVQAGQGQYTWIDYNGDGVAQLNEFEIAAFKDQANYIRIYTPTGEYVKADYTQFNYSIMLNPASILDDNVKGWKAFARRINLQSSLQTNKKVVSKGSPQFNPFQGSIEDSSVLNLNYIWSNTVSFNRSSSVWGMDITNLKTYDKSLLNYGSESNQVQQWIVKERININRMYTIGLRQEFNTQKLDNPAYINRNYSLSKTLLEPTLTYTSGSRFRIQGQYQYYTNKNKEEYGGENATSNAFSIESKYNSFQSLSISGKFTYNDIKYTGDVNSTVGYIMLTGLSAGKNLLWNLNMTKRFLKNMECTIQYDGRKAAASRIIHIGTVTVRAVL
ncbi:MAG: hypothetical protein DI598_08035 [Pseudopedobacter saltans]|uniref:Uncharacterized protein n=1 Tax=Pseudopedobacter saltans TaxID=151895 RepID=A0A2W5EZE4_9SPHI|nr:MAG: hypothetical protein DI598_08035 [Pseudopedobacter saltans]